MVGKIFSALLFLVSSTLCNGFTLQPLTTKSMAAASFSSLKSSTKMSMSFPSGEDIFGFTSQLIAYTIDDDEGPSFISSGDSDGLILGTIAFFTVAVAALLAVLGKSLTSAGSQNILLNEEEFAAISAIQNLFDPTPKDKELLEAGTVGELKRSQIAKKAKEDYQRGKDVSEVRDRTLYYAEIDLSFLVALLRIAKPKEGEVFYDLGSGCGKAVFAASLLHPFSKAKGVEFLEGLTKQANSYKSTFNRLKVPPELNLSKSPVEFINQDMYDPNLDLTDGDIFFAYSTRYTQGRKLDELSQKLADSCKPGDRIITIDKNLVGSRFKLIQELDDPNGDLQLLRGYVYRVV